MKQLHLTFDEDSPAIHWANAQTDKIGARGYVGTHLDCYTTVPKQSEYEIDGNVIENFHLPQYSKIAVKR